MSTPSTFLNQDQNWFNQNAPTPFKSNRRLGVRFIRDDITVSARKASIFNLGFRPVLKAFSVTMLDISSRGILVASNVKLSLNKKILLTLRFVDLREFEILGTVIRETETDTLSYGIKFDHVDNRFADYLVVSQKTLTFK